MLYQIIKFELQYRIKRPATYLYFLLLFFLAFGLTSTDIVETFVDGSQLKINAPAIIGRMLVTLLLLAIPVCASIMGVAVVRDFDHKIDSLLFTTSISKFNYLLGRFSGSFVVFICVISAIMAGMIAGYH